MNRLLLFLSLLAVEPALLRSSAAELIATGTERDGLSVSYLAEPSKGQAIVLDANNGFFDNRVFVAGGKRESTATDKPLISSHFDFLQVRGDATGTARWHLWIPHPGEIQVTIEMQIPVSEAGVGWTVSLGDQSRSLRSVESDRLLHHPQSLAFVIKEKGKYTLELVRTDAVETPQTRIGSLRLTGSAIKEASLLRARWRPAAVHTQYFSSTCPETQLWVFESQNDCEQTSYSPMTTQFGYFGASFATNGRSAGGVNFSMWAANSKATKAPPLDTMPHLLATGNPAAEFSGFGHEGSGVKIRNWEPYRHQPKSVIQALRIESDGRWNTFSGYLFDERTNRWVLYAIGRKPKAEPNRRQTKTGKRDGKLRPASFCEVPGPPQTQRTGDQIRTIRRRGWFYSKDKQWHMVDRQTSRLGKEATNKWIGSDDGWLTMSTGGMEMVHSPDSVTLDRGDRVRGDHVRGDRFLLAPSSLMEVPSVMLAERQLR